MNDKSIQLSLDFTKARRFGGVGHTHIGNLAVSILNREGLEKYINNKKVPYDEQCYNCYGSGKEPSNNDDWSRETCISCQGKGKVQNRDKLENAEFTWLYNKINDFVKHSCDIKPEFNSGFYYTPT